MGRKKLDNPKSSTQAYLDWLYAKAMHKHHGLDIEPGWINSFDCFIKDKGFYDDTMRLIRIDFKKGYLKDNCMLVLKSNYKRAKAQINSKSGFMGVVKAGNVKQNNKTYIGKKWIVSLQGRHIARYDNPLDGAIRYDLEVKKAGLNKPLNFGE